MHQITLNLPESTALALKISPEQLTLTIRLTSAIKLYELGKLSSGAAAELAGIPKVLFLTKLADYGVDTFNLTESELIEDLDHA
ncbi:MAG TPA: UPF0175 family protein [Allocoleopsis sp.]